MIQATEFVKRQTRESRFSYCYKSWDWVCELVEKARIGDIKEGYREGVMLVSVPANNFYCGVVKIEEGMEFEKHFEARREGEKPFSYSVAIIDEKPPAKFVDIILYARHVLEEDPLCEDLPKLENSKWFIVSVNCRQTEEEYPIPPLTMARNQLVEAGGTAGDYTAEQFAKSISFWSQHSLCRER